MIRGAEAERDENFCRETAERLGVRLYVRRRDVPALAITGGSIEEVARRERYSFFDDICRNSKPKTLVATAHNADDNLETVLFNLMRGSGLRGMCGIPPIRDGKYIRPLLTFSGEEVRGICRTDGIPFVFDSTNAETDYTRNRIRQRIVPELRAVSPTVESAALRMSVSLREDADFIDSEVEKFSTDRDGSANASELRLLEPAIRARVLRRMWCKASGTDICALEAVHIRSISELLRRGGDFSLSVPGRLVFSVESGRARFAGQSSVAEPTFCGEYPLGACGDTVVFGRTLVVTVIGEKSAEMPGAVLQYGENIYNLSINESVSFDKIKGRLMLRTRRPGDKLRFGGMSRSVKKIMSSRHIPCAERNAMPVFADDFGIVWVPGFPLRDGIAPSEGERRLDIYIYREDAE